MPEMSRQNYRSDESFPRFIAISKLGLFLGHPLVQLMNNNKRESVERAERLHFNESTFCPSHTPIADLPRLTGSSQNL